MFCLLLLFNYCCQIFRWIKLIMIAPTLTLVHKRQYTHYSPVEIFRRNMMEIFRKNMKFSGQFFRLTSLDRGARTSAIQWLVIWPIINCTWQLKLYGWFVCICTQIHFWKPDPSVHSTVLHLMCSQLHQKVNRRRNAKSGKQTSFICLVLVVAW